MKRLVGETFAEYRKRRKEEKERTKTLLKPRLFWDSARLGTYRRPK